MSSQFGLLHERRFLPFFLTQFLGAFNDNLFKNALVVLITFQAARYTALSPGVLVNLAAGIFILPFFLFSASAGQLADKYEKSRLIRLIKFAEILVMGLAALAFAVDSLGLLLTTLFLMGTQSSLFGPVKYAILPAHLREHELVGGNALVESGTFVAILLGTIAGGLMIATADGALSVSLAALAVATGGYLASRHIPAAPIADAALAIGWNPLTETWRNIRFARSNRTVFLSILGISWFWFYGALFLSQFPGYAREMLGGDEHTVTLLLAVFSVGIGVGSLLCERLSGRHVEIGLVPFGSIGLSLFALDLWWVSPAAAHAGMPLPIGIVLEQALTWRVMFDLVMIGAFGGLFIVPLYALVQSRSDAACRSRVIAGNNILNAAFMVVAALLGAVLLAAGATIPQLILLTAVLNAAVAIYIYSLVPEFLLRFIVWLLVHLVYRLRIDGEAHVPMKGPALIVANHVSFVDALVIMADPLRHGSQDLPLADPVLRLPHQPGDPDRLGAGRSGGYPPRLRRGRPRPRCRRTGRHLSRGPDHRRRRTAVVPARGALDPQAQCGAGGADGTARTVGQLLQPHRRPRDEPALPPRPVQPHRAHCRRAACTDRGGSRRTAAAGQGFTGRLALENLQANVDTASASRHHFRAARRTKGTGTSRMAILGEKQ